VSILVISCVSGMCTKKKKTIDVTTMCERERLESCQMLSSLSPSLCFSK
jgi:hypothetical protein